MANSQLGIFDYSLSLDRTEERIIGTGKNVMYLSSDDFLTACSQSNGNVWVRQRTSRAIPAENRIYLDAVWGKDKIVSTYIKRDQEIRTLAMNTIDKQLHPLFFQSVKDDNSWVSFQDFLATL